MWFINTLIANDRSYGHLDTARFVSCTSPPQSCHSVGLALLVFLVLPFLDSVRALLLTSSLAIGKHIFKSTFLLLH